MRSRAPLLFSSFLFFSSSLVLLVDDMNSLVLSEV